MDYRYIIKGGTMLKNLLVSPKDKDTITKKGSVIYWFRYHKTDCEDEYVEEPSTTFGERYKEHLRPHNISGVF